MKVVPARSSKTITLNKYQKHWIHTRPYGHDIVIWSDTGKTTIQCIWPDRRRSNDGRVKTKESGSKTIKNSKVQIKSNKR